jgi:MarR family transcriptional regulator, organic hydroperoxide resistance regulator
VQSNDSEPSILIALQRATHRTLQTLAHELGTHEITASEMNVLANLGHGGPRSVRQLSLDTGTKPTTLTSVLDRLERRGFVVRELDAADRRSFRISLTSAGRRAAADVRQAIARLEKRALDRVADHDLSGFRAVITALVEDP